MGKGGSVFKLFWTGLLAESEDIVELLEIGKKEEKL